jgi:predicted O-linked N-acetylglucosamine transferase (SPINDLY family)
VKKYLVSTMSNSSIAAQIAKYEEAVNQDNNIDNYWWLGISYLLSGDIEEAQATWFIPFANANSEIESASFNVSLCEVLQVAAREQTVLQNYQGALQLREQFQEIESCCLENILELVLLSNCCNCLFPDSLQKWGLKEAIIHNQESLDSALIIAAFQQILLIVNVDNIDDVLVFIECSGVSKELVDLVVSDASAGKYNLPNASWLLFFEGCLKSQPEHIGLLHYLSVMYSTRGDFDKSILIAEKYHSLCFSDLDKVYGYFLLIRSLMEANNFYRVAEEIKKYQELLVKILDNPPADDKPSSYQVITTATGFFPYLQDTPAQTHGYLNRIGEIYQQCLDRNNCEVQLSPENSTSNSKPNGVIRIGYIASTLYSHSVGWLSRWLWEYHNKEKFEVFTYFVKGSPENLFTRKWFQEKAHTSYYVGGNAIEIAELIKENEIDILIDLDSLTESVTYEVMARRPAPVQVTWLGWDACGCPGIDYFIADPYVLPDNAQSYYKEKIWRLPETYVAVDGFEIGIPNIKRADFGLTASDIIYFSAQKGFKLNEGNIIAQMQIIKQVPNSHLLVKARSDNDTSKKLYSAIAEQVGLDFSRIHFLGRDPDEMTHRANLQIADIVLDTFPYNGATTTLETLWLGIPMVTKVGEQFAARNAYGFMMNAGITEGISYTVEEYIDWGIKLGLDGELRKNIHEKLRASRNTSSLWNGEKFTRQIEQAYQEMWDIYLQDCKK